MHIDKIDGIKKLNKSVLLGIYILAFSIRLTGIYIEMNYQIGGHVAERYTDIAMNIVTGKGFVNSPGDANTFEPPIYPYFISLIFLLSKNNLTAVKICQGVLDSFNAIVIFFIAKSIFNPVSGILASILYSIYPVAVYSVADIAPETIFSLLLSLTIFLLTLAFQSNKLYYFIVSGLLLGSATLTRSTTLFFIPFIFTSLIIRNFSYKLLLKPLLVMSLGFLIVILPWTIRNYIVSHRFIPVAAMDYGEVFLQGSSEEFLVIKDKYKNFLLFSNQLRVRGIELPLHATRKQFNDYALRAGWEKYRERWQSTGFLGIAAFLAFKFSRLWFSTESGTNHMKILLINVMILPFAIGGIILSMKLKIPVTIQWLIYSVLLYFIMLHVITVPLHRYMAPIMPYLIIYEASFLSQMASHFKSLKHATRSRRFIND